MGKICQNFSTKLTTSFKVTGENQKIGNISAFKVFTVYSILDANGNLIAQSEKVDWIGTEFNLFDTHKSKIARISVTKLSTAPNNRKPIRKKVA